MSRKAGTPNKPKVDREILTVSADNEGKITVTNEQGEVLEQGSIDGATNYPYSILEANSRSLLEDHVAWAMDSGYVCQGGVSVTNYRANDGSIVMVYCRGMIRKEM